MRKLASIIFLGFGLLVLHDHAAPGSRTRSLQKLRVSFSWTSISSNAAKTSLRASLVLAQFFFVNALDQGVFSLKVCNRMSQLRLQ